MPKRRGHGEGSIYQRKDGTWCAVVDLGYIGGKRRRKSFYGPTRKDVAEKLKIALREKQLGGNLAPERQTVAQFLTRWLNDVVALKVRPRTLELYRDIVRLHLIPSLGRIQLAKLSPQDVQAMIGRLLADGRSPRTITLIRSCLNTALKVAVAWGLTPRNAVDATVAPRITEAAGRAMTIEEIKRFLLAIRGDRLEVLYLTALTLGLRRGEVLGLRWQDIDFTAQTLRIESTIIQERSGRLARSLPKTAQGRRVLPLPGFLADALALHHDTQARARALAGAAWQEHGVVFTTSKGTPIHPRDALAFFHRALTKAGLPTMRFHDLRHSCASLLAALNVHPRIAMEILGHANIAITQNLYTHVFDESKREVAILLNDLITSLKEE